MKNLINQFFYIAWISVLLSAFHIFSMTGSEIYRMILDSESSNYRHFVLLWIFIGISIFWFFRLLLTGNRFFPLQTRWNPTSRVSDFQKISVLINVRNGHEIRSANGKIYLYGRQFPDLSEAEKYIDELAS